MSNIAKKTIVEEPPLSIEETEKLLLERLQNAKTEDDHFRWLLFVVGYYRGADRIDAAKALLQRFLVESTKAERKVHCHLALGQIATDQQEFQNALNHFTAALGLKPASKKVEYVLLNNAGYCHNMLGRYSEGERQCRMALELDWVRPSAYRNLGVSLHGAGNLIAAAWALVESNKADPADNRARVLLERLVSLNPDLVVASPWIMDGLDPSNTKAMETCLI
jgi:Flp pilus assembly protein TadD